MPQERPNIENYMTVGKAMELSSIWDVAGLSSSIRLGARSRPKLATTPFSLRSVDASPNIYAADGGASRFPMLRRTGLIRAAAVSTNAAQDIEHLQSDGAARIFGKIQIHGSDEISHGERRRGGR